MHTHIHTHTYIHTYIHTSACRGSLKYVHSIGATFPPYSVPTAICPEYGTKFPASMPFVPGVYVRVSDSSFPANNNDNDNNNNNNNNNNNTFPASIAVVGVCAS